MLPPPFWSPFQHPVRPCTVPHYANNLTTDQLPNQIINTEQYNQQPNYHLMTIPHTLSLQPPFLQNLNRWMLFQIFLEFLHFSSAASENCSFAIGTFIIFEKFRSMLNLLLQRILSLPDTQFLPFLRTNN